MKRQPNQRKAAIGKIAEGIEAEHGNVLRRIKEVEYLGTGIRALDWALGRGLPVGRMTEVFGEFATGKSVLGLQLAAKVQREGGVSIVVDSERRFSVSMAKALGIDTEEVIYIPGTCLEETYDRMATAVAKAREHFDGDIYLMWDSLGSTQSRDEMEGKVDLGGQRGRRAYANSVGLAKMTPLIDDCRVAFYMVNQLRVKPDVVYGKTWYTMGGKAPEFYSTVQVMLSKGKEIEGERREIVGQRGKLRVVKNTVAPPFRGFEFELFFDRGIPEESGWVDTLVQRGLVIVSGGWCYVNADKEKRKFRKADIVKFLAEHPELEKVVTG